MVFILYEFSTTNRIDFDAMFFSDLSLDIWTLSQRWKQMETWSPKPVNVHYYCEIQAHLRQIRVSKILE